MAIKEKYGPKEVEERIQEWHNVDKGKEKVEILEDVSISRTRAGSMNRFAILESMAKK